MTEQALRKMIAAGESTRQEFKSWVKCKDYRQRKDLAVKSAVALANTKGGVLLFGVEDDGTITGCPKSDPQALMEAIYDMTRPSLFTEIEPVETSDGVVLVVSVEKSSSHVATTAGIYYRRLGNVTKPYYPANDVYSPADNPDFSAKIVEGATESDIDLLEVYRLKEKLRIRDAGSALPDLADTTFLDNLNLIRMDKDEVRVTAAGPLVRQLAAQFCESPLADRCELSLTQTEAAERALLDADPALLGRLLENLLNNSVRHNAGPVKVSLCTEVVSGRFCLTVADDGAGYPPQVLAALHEPEPGENAPHILGLHVVEQIAAAHGGQAVFSQNLPHGAKTTVWLPLHPEK